MPFTETGFEARKFSDILPEINESLQNDLGVSLDVSADSVLGIMMNIFAAEVSTQEALTQAMADNFDIDKASGTYLDSLVALSGLSRLTQSYSVGSAFFLVSVDGTTIPRESLISDTQENIYEVLANTVVSSSNCTGVKVKSNGTSRNYTLYINGVEYTRNYVITPSTTQYAVDLEYQINQSAEDDYTVTRDGDEVFIQAVNKFDDLDVSKGDNVLFTGIEGRVSIIAQEIGEVDPQIGTITNLITINTNVEDVTNYDTLTVGRLRETDDELRIRHQSSSQTSRNSTARGIYSRLANITGVSLVRIFENTTQLTDSDGRPPHSYECVVEGGNEIEIATAIYESKPAGVETYGTDTYTVNDYVGNIAGVSWSRPNPKYINVRVYFSRYDEESLPDDAVSAIKEAIVEYGDGLGLDVDIIPQRMYGTIYGAVDGLGDITVEIGTSSTPNSTTPNETSYSTSSIAISERDKADFNTVRIQVIEV